MLTVTQESGTCGATTCPSTRTAASPTARSSSPGHVAALRRAAQICAAGYQPGTIERGCSTQAPKTHHDMRPLTSALQIAPARMQAGALRRRRLPRTASPAGPPPVPAPTFPMSRGPGVSEAAFWRPWRPGPAWHSRDGHMLAGVGRLGSMRDPDTARWTAAELRDVRRPGGLAAIRICPLAATKKTP